MHVGGQLISLSHFYKLRTVGYGTTNFANALKKEFQGNYFHSETKELNLKLIDCCYP